MIASEAVIGPGPYFIMTSFSLLCSLAPQGDLQQRSAATAATSAAAACIICKSTDKCVGRAAANLPLPLHHPIFSLLLCRVRKERRAEEVVEVDESGWKVREDAVRSSTGCGGICRSEAGGASSDWTSSFPPLHPPNHIPIIHSYHPSYLLSSPPLSSPPTRAL